MDVTSHSGETVSLPRMFPGNIQEKYSTKFLETLRDVMIEIENDEPISASDRSIAKIFELSVKQRWDDLVIALTGKMEDMDEL